MRLSFVELKAWAESGGLVPFSPEKLPTCWNCSHCGQAVTLDRRDLVCRFYGEIRVLGRVGDFIGVPEDCPKKGKEAKK